MPEFVDDPEVFLRLLSDAGVNQMTQQYIKDKGYDTIALVAFAIPENSIEEVVKHLTPVADGGSFEPFSPQASCLRRALTRCVRCMGTMEFFNQSQTRSSLFNLLCMGVY